MCILKGFEFDDEISFKFCCDLKYRKIEIYFEGYFDLTLNQYFEKQCFISIEKWENIKIFAIGFGEGDKEYSVKDKIGIVSMILDIEEVGSWWEFDINTLDNRFIRLCFENPTINVNIYS